MKLICRKIDETRNSTVSTLHLESEYICTIIEDGLRLDKVAGDTRISAGIYPFVKRTYGDFYERYKRAYGHDCVFEIIQVPNFVGIIPHIGNFIADTRGCPLLNVGFCTIEGNYRGMTSRDAYLKFYERVRPLVDQFTMAWEVIR